jgi:copper chaperone CopZ
LERLPGITKAVDYESHKATIRFDPAKQDRKALAKVVFESGYRVKD